MPFEFRLPDIGEGTVEGEIVKWHVKPGQQVKEDDPLVEVMTDKATVIIPSPRKGTILQTLGEEGSIVKVGAVILTLDTGGDSATAAAASAETPAKAVAPARKPQEAAPSTGRALATPAIRKMAQDMGIDINQVTGTGAGGRVTKEDLLGFGKQAPAAAKAESAVARAPGKEEVEEIPLRGLQEKVAEKMAQSK